MTAYLVGLALGLVLGAAGAWLSLVAKMDRYRAHVQQFADDLTEDYNRLVESHPDWDGTYDTEETDEHDYPAAKTGDYSPDAWGGKGGYLL